jgi:hypothetical protein
MTMPATRKKKATSHGHRPPPAPPPLSASRVNELEQEILSLSRRCSSLELQASRFWKLYVTSHRLLEPTSRQGVIEVIQEIVGAIIGSEQMAIFEREPDPKPLSLVAVLGVDKDMARKAAVNGGPVERSAREGKTFVMDPLPSEWGALTASIPLMVGGRPKGALAIFGLLPQKRGYEREDHDILRLLSLQAGLALQCADPS